MCNECVQSERANNKTHIHNLQMSTLGDVQKHYVNQYRPLWQLITSRYLSVICRKTGAHRCSSGGQNSVLSTLVSVTILNTFLISTNSSKQRLSELLCIASTCTILDHHGRPLTN